MHHILSTITILVFLVNKIKCEEFCNFNQTKYKYYISNGAATKPGEWPWHVALYHRIDSKPVYQCGGTILSKDFVLTGLSKNKIKRYIIIPSWFP